MNNVLNTSPDERRPMNIDEAEDAILARWEDPDARVSDDNEQEATPDIDDEETTDVEEYEEEAEEVDPDEDDEDPENEDEELEDDEEAKKKLKSLMTTLKLKSWSMVKSIGHLSKTSKGYTGVEKSLTRKSQAVAQQRKQAEDALQKVTLCCKRCSRKLKNGGSRILEVDFLVASKTMDDADFTALRKEAQQAQDDLRFLKEEADNFYKQDMQKQQKAAQQEAAREAVKVLQENIPDWSNELYNDIRAYAVCAGHR